MVSIRWYLGSLKGYLGGAGGYSIFGHFEPLGVGTKDLVDSGRQLVNCRPLGLRTLLGGPVLVIRRLTGNSAVVFFFFFFFFLGGGGGAGGCQFRHIDQLPQL